MNRMETQNILNKIKVFRQSFLILKETIEEWTKILEPYDYSDVDKKLDEYFRESNNFGQYPDPYYLSRNLTTKSEKEKYRDVTITCQICGEKVSHGAYAKHFDRCSSIDYLCRMSERFYNKKMDRQELLQLSDETFKRGYWNFCENLYNQMPDGLEKRALENAILTHKGIKPKFNTEELTQLVGRRK